MLFDRKCLKVSSRPHITHLLEEQYVNMIANIKKEMSGIRYFCTTTDLWSAKRRSFLGYTCHWIDSNLHWISVSLACKRFGGTHSGERIAEMISEINSSFNLDHEKIVATVMDNGSNFVKAFEDFGISFQPNHDEDDAEELYDERDILNVEPIENSILLPKHLRCASHTLNLLATSDFIKILKKNERLMKEHYSAIGICNQLWNKCAFPKSAEIIQNILSSSLIRPVKTRWNSLFDAILKVLENKSKLNELCSKLSVPKFTQKNLNYLIEYTELMKPFAETLDFLQQEKNLIYGYFLPALASLRTKLRKLEQSNKLKILDQVIRDVEDKLVSRFSIYFELKPESDDAIVAAVLCPSLKKKWLSSLGTNTRADLAINNLLLKYAQDFSLAEGEACQLPEDNLADESNFFEFIDNELTRSSTRGSTYVANLVSSYLNDTDISLRVLHKYPLLHKMFVKLNTPLTSSAPVERLFSLAGIINNPRRQSLTDEHFEQLVLMKANIKWMQHLNISLKP